MATSRRFSVALVLTLLVALAAIGRSAYAQEVTASIVGTITDQSGAPISGADVIATDVDRGTVWTVKTNESGSYNITRLPIGNFLVKVSAAGFQTANYPQFRLVLNQTARVDVQMKIGQASETVEVVGATPLLQTESTQVSTLVDSNTLSSLPLAARNYVQLTLLSPGATNVNPESMTLPQNQLNAGRPYINGNREQANLFLLDGQVNAEKKNDETGYNPPADAIQQFNLITQNASAEFGNYEGGIINATIKSGTNNFHGELFEFLRNDALNANKFINGMTKGTAQGILQYGRDGTIPKPRFHYNQFGGTFGGPIIKNRLFFFADYQGQRLQNIGNTGQVQLATQLERSGNFGQLCTQHGGAFDNAGVCSVSQLQIVDPRDGTLVPFNDLASYIATGHGGVPVGAFPALSESVVAQNLFQQSWYPLPQFDVADVNNSAFFQTGNNLNNDQGDLKIDYVATAKDRIFGRWSQMNLRNPSYGKLIAFNGGGLITDPIRNAVIDWSHTFGPAMINEARVGFGAVHYTQKGTPMDSLGNVGQTLGIQGANPGVPGLLQIAFSGDVNGAAGFGYAGSVQVFHTSEGQAEDNLIFTRGRHQIKTGFQYWRERQDYVYGGNFGTLGTISINDLTQYGLADLWLGDVGGGQRDGTGGNQLFGLRGNIVGAYVQDDWRVTNTLTANLGVRFEDHTPFYEIHDRYVNFGLYNGVIYTPTGVAGTTKYNNRSLKNNYLGIGDWMPRIGLSWSPAALNGKTVIRAGFGISSYMEGSGANEELTQNPPFYGATQSPNNAANNGIGALQNGFLGTISPCAPNPDFSFACYAGKRIRVFDPNFRPTLTQQWNLTIQQQLSNSLTFQIGYVGQHGTHLLNFFDATQLIGLNAAGKIARPGEPIVSRVAGPFLGGSAPGSLYAADNSTLGGSNAIAGTNMSNASQRYDALQAVLEKRMGNGLQGQIAYTYSKCLANSPGYYGTGWGSGNAQSSGGQPGWQNSYDPRADWGPCYFDQTHILSSYIVYQLPIGRGKQFGHDLNPALNAVLGNWEISGIVSLHSGNALTLNEFGGWGAFNGDPSNTNGIGNYFLSARPSCSGPLRVVNKKIPGDANTNGVAYIQWFDTSVVSHPTNSFGTCSVGNGRGPGLASVDLGLHKDFNVTERMSLQFRAEAINAFNHPVMTFSGGPAGGSFDPGSPVTGPIGGRPSELTSNQNFGNITGSQSSRQLQLALKLMF